jgi:hypothetical protein
LWKSDKLARVTPVRFRAEYANVLPLALANGTCEIGAARVWAEVFAYNRDDVTRADVEKMLAEFERCGLLFRWNDEGRKQWGFFVDIEKPGRLPSASMRRHYGTGPEPPQDQLAAYLQRIGTPQPETPKPVAEKRSTIKTPLPEGFGITDGLREWAKSKGFCQLEAHLEHFIDAAKARGYTYADWTAAFQKAIRENWAKLPVTTKSSGPSAVERAKAQLEWKSAAEEAMEDRREREAKRARLKNSQETSGAAQ